MRALWMTTESQGRPCRERGAPRCHHISLRLVPLATALSLLLLLTACRASVTASTPPSGTYTSVQFHFSVKYPTGWQATQSPVTSLAVPLTLVITHGGDTAASGLVSSFTVTVFNVHAPSLATPIAQIKARAQTPNASLRPITLAGHPAYQSAPAQRPLPGGTLTITHTDYYLFTSDFEYQIGADSVSAEHADADLKNILHSFTLTA